MSARGGYESHQVDMSAGSCAWCSAVVLFALFKSAVLTPFEEGQKYQSRGDYYPHPSFAAPMLAGLPRHDTLLCAHHFLGRPTLKGVQGRLWMGENNKGRNALGSIATQRTKN